MYLGILKETTNQDKRVSITPNIAEALQKLGLKVMVESGAGELSGYLDQDYIDKNIKVASKQEVLSCNIITKTNPFTKDEIDSIKPDSIVVGNLKSLLNKDQISNLAQKRITSYAMELMPRISRAQSMDILSSQSNLMGYMSVIQSAYHCNKVLPLMMTSAGTVAPAKAFIIGVGVAGLQAIATAKRLGCVVSAYDVRPETKEQVESLGAKFISVAKPDSKNEGPSVYAKEMDAEYKLKEREMLLNHVAKQDIIITTALIMGKKSPILIDSEMLSKMQKGSIIIDLAIENGGNCIESKIDEIVEVNGVKIVGLNMINYVSKQASDLFAKNIYNFLSPHINKETGVLNLDMEDELVKGTLATHQGNVVHNLLKN